MPAPSERENAYGYAKRLAYFEAVIRAVTPRRILDVGCGTGDDVTRPLAERFPAVTVVGVDEDQATIRYARSRPGPPNLTFACAAEGTFDVVIASEVLEHVPDPVEFVQRLRDHLEGPRSTLLVTVPNGRGIFEATEVVSALVDITGLRRMLAPVRQLVRRYRAAIRRGTTSGSAPTTNTLAASRHINFFDFRTVTRVLEAGGFEIVSFRARSMACGYGVDRLIRGPIADLNARVADWFPRQSSGFMFRCVPTDVPDAGWRYIPSRYARWKRWLNLHRSGAPGQSVPSPPN